MDHSVNVTREHPLKEFFQLVLGVLTLGAVVLLVVHLAAGYFASKIPFRFEQAMVNHIDALKPVDSPQQRALQALADRLGAHMDLPPGMTVTVHYGEDDVVNAFATVGGHIFFYKGLVEKLESEDALAMVMAHEIAHVKHRHPIVSMGKGLTIMALMGSLVGMSGSTAGEHLLGPTVHAGLMKFSRDQETQSDRSAADAINKVYGHILGAKGLFEMFDGETGSLQPPEILSSHPHSIGRWESLKAIAQSRGWQTEGVLTPLTFRY